MVVFGGDNMLKYTNVKGSLSPYVHGQRFVVKMPEIVEEVSFVLANLGRDTNILILFKLYNPR